MRNSKGLVAIMVVFGVTLVIGGMLYLMHNRYTKFVFSYEEEVLMTIKLDDLGSELLAILNAGDSEVKYIEFLGGSAAKGTESGSKQLEDTLDNLNNIMMRNHNIEVIIPGTEPGEEISYGPKPPENTDSMKGDIPLPCSSSGQCRGKVRLRKW